MPYVAVALGIGLLVCLWLIFGRGPRRARAHARARRLLAQDQWPAALELAQALQAESGLAPAWHDRARILAGDCHQRAADQALKEQRFEEGLQHGLQAAQLLRTDASEAHGRVVERMLAESRRLFARAETDAVIQLLQRTFAVQAPCPEGSFWLGLCQLRKGDRDAAVALLTAAHEQSGKQYLDAAFYLGLLLHRRGRPQEALRYLSDANRVDGSCPFVTWQMGISLVAAGGDAGLASRALQRALGPRGLGLWVDAPQRAWVEAFPEGRSFVRRLAEHHPYVCPVLGDDLPAIVRQGQLALAQAYYKQGNFQDAADLFGRLMQEMPPTVPLLRGLGLALSRLGLYDRAYKHLRVALEEEQPKDALTAGYLALCGALAPPTQPEDKPKNVLWALKLMARYPLLGDAEWVGLLGAVHAEARSVEMVIGVEDQVLLCDAQASIVAEDAAAAAAFRHLAATYPAALKPAHAWLFARAAATGAAGPSEPRDLELFERAWANAAAARAFHEPRGWDFADAEYAYLTCAATHAPGAFPAALGADYAPHGERFLLQRLRAAEEAGQADAALTAAEALLRLAPRSLPAHDHFARLLYRRGETDRAAELLTGWQRLAPRDHWPLVRLAILEQERGQANRRAEAIDRALGLTSGPLRAAVAFVGARLALRQNFHDTPSSDSNGHVRPATQASFADAQRLLQQCLQDEPTHIEAQWHLAAVYSIVGDRAALAAQAAVMDRPAVRDARFHFFGAVCCLAARDYGKSLELARRAAEEKTLTDETHYLMAWAYLNQGDSAAARQALQRAARDDASPSVAHARALLGKLSFDAGAYDEASSWWNKVDPRWRSAWQLEEPARQTTLLAGLHDYEAGRFEAAAQRFREAGRLGLRDRRIGSLLTLALVQAGRRLLYDGDSD